jgi:hypothetical protein
MCGCTQYLSAFWTGTPREINFVTAAAGRTDAGNHMSPNEIGLPSLCDVCPSAVSRSMNDSGRIYRYTKVQKPAGGGLARTCNDILLFILVALAGDICIEKPAEAQSGGWCAYLNGGGHDRARECGFATMQQCLAEVRGFAETVRPVRTTSRHASGIDQAILLSELPRYSPRPIFLCWPRAAPTTLSPLLVMHGEFK